MAIFLVYLVPPSLLFLSLSRLVVGLGLQDSTWSLVLIYPPRSVIAGFTQGAVKG